MPAANSYWHASRAPRYSVLFALPLLVAYELLAAALERGSDEAVRNGADVLLKSSFIAVAGARGPMMFGLALVGLATWFVWRDVKARGAPRRLGYFAFMALESLGLALATGTIVGLATSQLLGGLASLSAAPATEGRLTGLMLSLGAGLYEELLFRVLLVGALAAAGERFAGLRPLVAGAIATVIGALVFSGFHYVGQYGDPFELQSFTFRALAGLFFSALYLLRGFGITAWTHALYDVFILAL